jgi:predicted nuclease of predicted toxin-antitoxin system
MKFLANENFPIRSFKILQDTGLDIKHIYFIEPSILDEQVMEIAINEERIILTFDRDYGELVFRYGYKPKGVVLFRYNNFRPTYPAQIFLEILESIHLEGLFTVLSEDSPIRQRVIHQIEQNL